MSESETNSPMHEAKSDLGGRAIEPESRESHAQAASELVVQGLLEYVHRGDGARREERLAKFFDGLDGSAAPARVFVLRRYARWGLAIAAMIGICTILVLVGVPGESSALAEVKQSIAAMKNAGERRYEVSFVSGDGAAGAKDVNAIIDTSGPGLLLIRHKPPWARDFVAAGRDEKGAWATTRDGLTTRDHPERNWPPFVTDGGESLIMDSMDRLLDGLPDRFDLRRGDAAMIPGSGSASATRTYDRITARRKTTAGPQPNTVELWIDPSTKLVERIEYHWDTGLVGRSAGDGVGRGDKGGDGGPGGGPGGKPHGPPPGDDMDGPGRGPPPAHHDHGPDDFGPGGPHGHGPDDHGPSGHGDRPPPPPDGDGPGGPGGPRGAGARDDHGPGRDGGRRGMGGSDRGGPGNAPGGMPRMIVFQRVDAAAFPAGWFTPEGHAPKPTDH